MLSTVENKPSKNTVHDSILCYVVHAVQNGTLLFVSIRRCNSTIWNIVFFKARLHRRFLSQQLDAIFVAPKIASSFKHVRNPCDIAATKSFLVYTCDFEVATWARQKLHRVAATKIACVNGPLQQRRKISPWLSNCWRNISYLCIKMSKYHF